MDPVGIPLRRIATNVPSNPLQGVPVAHHVFVEIALPDITIRRIP
jgi:hypothetical protein